MSNQLEDPVMRSLSRVVASFVSENTLLDDLFQESVAVADKLDEKDKLEENFRAFTAAIYHFQNFELECHAFKDGGSGLAHAATHLAQIESFFSRSRSTLESALACFGHEDGDLPNGLLTTAVDEFENFQMLMKQVTPAQLTLQAHLLALVASGPFMTMRERERVFVSLITLRDKYFAEASADTLSEYLSAAETLTSKNSIKYRGRRETFTPELLARFTAAAERYTVELEVLSLMDTLVLERGIR